MQYCTNPLCKEINAVTRHIQMVSYVTCTSYSRQENNRAIPRPESPQKKRSQATSWVKQKSYHNIWSRLSQQHPSQDPYILHFLSRDHLPRHHCQESHAIHKRVELEEITRRNISFACLCHDQFMLE